ncbi:MAG TPA: ABC transporter ATP-binding protein [Candidatus Saccharibacteria bacterium]|nr:ABC transporter ATP-binding protein [Candidatus Saccharibacteria bacterium]
MKNQESKKAVISVNNVSKNFKLPHDRKNSLKQHFVGLFKGKSNYEKFEALKDINFTVNEGDFFGIVGRNGSGKSTLLKIISGIYQPSSGSVKINGTLTPFIELGIGFNPELTGRENVYLNGSILGLTKKEINELYDEIVKFAELERFMDQKLKNYSSGMQVRLAFSIAIRAQNDILLLDEVLAVGDINFQKKCFNYFQKLKSEKKTVIFVSHDMGAVQRFCNKGIFINNSETVFCGDIEEVSRLYRDEMLSISSQETKITQGLQMESESTKLKPKNVFRPIVIKKIALKSENRDGAVPILKQNENIDVEVTYLAKRKEDNPIFGILIFNASNPDVPVFGVNTLLPVNYSKKIYMEKDQEVTININLKNKFSGGFYFAKVAVVDSSGVIQYDEKIKNGLFVSDNTENNFSIFQSEYNISLGNNKEGVT